jgi:hypothetical protein
MRRIVPTLRLVQIGFRTAAGAPETWPGSGLAGDAVLVPVQLGLGGGIAFRDVVSAVLIQRIVEAAAAYRQRQLAAVG